MKKFLLLLAFIGFVFTACQGDKSDDLENKVEEFESLEVGNDNEIYYTSSNDYIVEPDATDVFGANIVSNTYENGKGVIKFDAPVTSIGERAFFFCLCLKSIAIPNSVTSIGEDAFLNCRSLASVTIGNGVTSIERNAFANCDNLTKLTIPNSVISIKHSAFSGCYSLTSITIPDSVTSIEGWTFHSCQRLKNITIPNSITSIKELTFFDCESLTSITIHEGITSIEFSAFKGCKSLKKVYCKPTIPPAGDTFMFEENAPGRKIYVPRASVDAYKRAPHWDYYASDIVGYDF